MRPSIFVSIKTKSDDWRKIMRSHLLECKKLVYSLRMQACFLIVLSFAIPKSAIADLVFGVPALSEAKSLLESPSCVQRCTNSKWVVERVALDSNFSSQLLPGDAVYLVTSTPPYCGASRCAQGYVLRDHRRFSILKNGFNISTRDPLRIEEIPSVRDRQQLPGLERTSLSSDGMQSNSGSCGQTAPTGVEELLVRQASELYAQAQRAQGIARRDLLQRTLALIDALVQAQPDSLLACQARQPGAQVGGIPLAQVRAELATDNSSASCPALNASRQKMVQELLRSYAGTRQDIALVAEYADHALLAWGAYDEPDVIDVLGERGWRALRSEWGQSDGVVGDVSATLFISRSGQHVLAFRGTQTLGDFLTDATVLPSDQVVEAARMALRIRDEFPDVVFVGHSMGGRFAQLARIITGNSAVVFNAAPGGLPDGVVRSIAGTAAPGAGTVFLHFAHSRDAVSSINPTRNIVVANAVSSDFELPPESHLLGPLLRGVLSLGTGFFTQRDVHHSMGMLAQAMQLVRVAQDEGWINAFYCHQRQRLAVAATLPPKPLQNAAIGATANSTSPVGVQPLGATPAVSNQANEISHLASIDEALRRASAAGPSADLVKTYMWLGQFDRGLQMLSNEVVLSTYISSPGIDINQHHTDTQVNVADWLTAQRRPDLSIQVLNEAERSVGATEWWRWAVIAKGYHRAGAARQAQAILGRWERAVAANRRADPLRQDVQALIETYVELGRMQDGRRIAATLQMDDCGFPFYMGGYRLQAQLGQHQQALTAARRCTDPTRQLVDDAVVGEVALGLAESGSFQTAQAILRQYRVDIAALHFSKAEHFGAAYARALFKGGRTSEARDIVARSAALLTARQSTNSCHEIYGHHEIKGVSDLINVGLTMELTEQNQRAAQLGRRYISRIGGTDRVGCTIDFVRFAQALLGMARQEASLGRTERGQALVNEADTLADSDRRIGQRVFAGTVALALAQRNPARLPARAAVADTAASGATSTENTLNAYIQRFPEGQFLRPSERDPPGWFGGQCVAWAKALFGLVASRSIDSLSGNAGQLPGNLRDMGFEVSEDPAAPRVGAMVAWSDGGFGHVGVVTQVHRSPVSNQITEITASEANWGAITEEGARRWGLSLEDAAREYVTEMYGTARSIRLPVNNLTRGSYRFSAYVYP